ncbi:UNVERIFIED_CONTAM: hypothetical protein K2H54_045257 [Gekko kuhli]
MELSRLNCTGSHWCWFRVCVCVCVCVTFLTHTELHAQLERAQHSPMLGPGLQILLDTIFHQQLKGGGMEDMVEFAIPRTLDGTFPDGSSWGCFSLPLKQRVERRG